MGGGAPPDHHGRMTTKQLWFARKRYGWGWTPVTWQGWAVIAAYAAFMAAGALLFLEGHGPWGVIAFVVWTLAYTLWLVSLSWQHGPRPGWQWGSRTPSQD